MKDIEKEREPRGEQFHPYFWGGNSSEKFVKALKKNKNDLEKLFNPSFVCPEQAREQFTKTLIKIADSAGIKSLGRKKANKDHNSSWFDNECRAMKLSIRKQGK